MTVLEHPLTGTTQTLQTACLAFPYDSAEQKVLKAEVELIAKDSNNDWREDGWIPVGSEIKIEKIVLLEVDLRGPWIGVYGSCPKPDAEEGTFRFLYCWSQGERLRRAPWEELNLPETRSTELFKSLSE